MEGSSGEEEKLHSRSNSNSGDEVEVEYLLEEEFENAEDLQEDDTPRTTHIVDKDPPFPTGLTWQQWGKRYWYRVLWPLLDITIPSFVSRLFEVMANFVASVLLANYDPTTGSDLTQKSSNLITVVQMLLLHTAATSLYSSSVLIGRFFKKQTNATDRLIGQTLRQSWIMAIPIGLITCVFVFFAGDLLHLLGIGKPITDIVTSYFRVYVFAVIPRLWMICHQQFFFSSDNTWFAVLLDLIHLVFRGGLGYIFVVGGFGIVEPMGAQGLGVASTIALTCGCITGFVYIIFRRSRFSRYRIFSDLKDIGTKQELGLLYKLARIGLPIGAKVGMERLSLSLVSIFVQQIGDIYLSVQEVVLQFTFLLSIPMVGLSQGAAITVAHACGKGKYRTAAMRGDCSIFVGIAFSTVVFIVYLVIPELLISLFMSSEFDEDLVQLSVYLLWISSIGNIFVALRDMCGGALRGLKDTFFPLVASVGCLWLFGIPLGYLTGMRLGYGLYGFFTWRSCGFFFNSIFLFIRWRGRVLELFQKLKDKNETYVRLENI